VYVPTAVVVHTGGHATARDPARMALEHHRSAWIYLANRYPGRRWAPLRWVLRAGLAARVAIHSASFVNVRGLIIFSVLNGVLADRMDNGPRGQAKRSECVLSCGTGTTIPRYIVAYTINNL